MPNVKFSYLLTALDFDQGKWSIRLKSLCILILVPHFLELNGT